MESGPAKTYGGGAGGKFRKPPARKPPSTPYDRPKVNRLTGERPRGWLSKLVSPAHDLISRGAAKLIPAFLSNSVGNTSDHGEVLDIHIGIEIDVCINCVIARVLYVGDEFIIIDLTSHC